MLTEPQKSPEAKSFDRFITIIGILLLIILVAMVSLAVNAQSHFKGLRIYKPHLKEVKVHLQGGKAI